MSLSYLEKKQLDEQGFLIIPAILSTEDCQSMVNIMNNLFAIEMTGKIGHARRCSNMQNKSVVFDLCLTYSKVLAGITHILKGNFRSLGISALPHLPGSGNEFFHVDYGGVFSGEHKMCNIIWTLCDFHENNGPTRVIPGTHWIRKSPGEVIPRRIESHPQEVLLLCPAGSAVVINSHLWHGPTQNNSKENRPSLDCMWRHREGGFEKRQSNWGVIGQEIANRFDDSIQKLFIIE